MPILRTIEIPLPPIDEQERIVAELEGHRKVIEGARQILASYKPSIRIDPEWPMVRLGDLCVAILTGPFGSSLHQSDYVSDGIPVINPKNIIDGKITTDGVKMVSPATRDRLSNFAVREKDLIIGRRGEMGRCAIASGDMNGWLCGTGCFVIRLNGRSDERYIYHQIDSPAGKAFLENLAIGVTLKNLNQEILSQLPIPLPPLAIQRQIVVELEAERKLVEANRELIARMEAKIQAKLAEVWGETVS